MKVSELDETLLRTLIEFNKAKEKAYKELESQGISRSEIMKSLENFKSEKQYE